MSFIEITTHIWYPALKLGDAVLTTSTTLSLHQPWQWNVQSVCLRGCISSSSAVLPRLNTRFKFRSLLQKNRHASQPLHNCIWKDNIMVSLPAVIPNCASATPCDSVDGSWLWRTWMWRSIGEKTLGYQSTAGGFRFKFGRWCPSRKSGEEPCLQRSTATLAMPHTNRTWGNTDRHIHKRI